MVFAPRPSGSARLRSALLDWHQCLGPPRGWRGLKRRLWAPRGEDGAGFARAAFQVGAITNRLAKALAMLSLVASCARDGTPDTFAYGGSECVAGERVECACRGGDRGSQVCAADGKSFGRCDCGGGGSAGTAAGGGGGAPSGAAGTFAGGAGATGIDGGTYDRCVEEAAGEDCAMCACDHCLAELAECNADETGGCNEIRDCARQEGCTGFACYGIGNGPCAAVIDGFGGPLGDSTNLASALSDCVVAATCPCG